MISSGTTAVVTTTNTAVTLIAANVHPCRNITIVNGSVAGFFSIDGGTTYCFMAASSINTLNGVFISSVAVKVKRITDGSDLANVYGYAW